MHHSQSVTAFQIHVTKFLGTITSKITSLQTQEQKVKPNTTSYKNKSSSKSVEKEPYVKITLGFITKLFAIKFLYVIFIKKYLCYFNIARLRILI